MLEPMASPCIPMNAVSEPLLGAHAAVTLLMRSMVPFERVVH